MKLLTTFMIILSMIISCSAKPPSAEAGFSLADDIQEFTMHYESVDNLIVLPVVINDSVKVNLILDTGCRNIVLFGKKLHRQFSHATGTKVNFSGLGNGRAITGNLSLNNHVYIGPVEGQSIPIVLVPHPNLFSGYRHIDGVIGYDIFIKFEVEINTARRLITFRPAAKAKLPSDFEKVALQIEDSRPTVLSKIFLAETPEQACSLMLDTGSTLGLLVKTTDLRSLPAESRKLILGRGLNGYIVGVETEANKILLDKFEITSVRAGITYSQWHNHASVGMSIMKDYIIVLNYCQSYAGFKKIS
jgi:hypothetical protein